MAIIHLEVEITKTLVQTLRKYMDIVRVGTKSCQGGYNTINNSWKGEGASMAFLNDFDALITNLYQQSEYLEALANRLDYEIDQWVNADNNGLKQIENTMSTELPNYTRSAISAVIGATFGFSLTEVSEFMLGTSSGMELESFAKSSGVKFILPDGTIIGDPNGEVINVRYGETADKGYNGYYDTDSKEIVIGDDLNWQACGKDTLASILGHEMQHAVDHENGMLYEFDSNAIQDISQLETHLEMQIESHIASEVRAYERTENILYGTDFVDDGITSSVERERILFDYGYEKDYESQLGDFFAGQYSVDVLFENRTGQMDIKLEPIDNSRITAFG